MFGLFRSKREKFSEDTVLLHKVTYDVAAKSTVDMSKVVAEQWNKDISPSFQYSLLREWYCFYGHLLDWFAFHYLGEDGRDFIIDQIVPLGIVPLVRLTWPNAGDDFWEPRIADMLSAINERQTLYAPAQSIFVSNMDAILKKGGVPGFGDVFEDEPTAKVSRLFRALTFIFNEEIPEFGKNSNKVRQTAEIWGISLEGASDLELFMLVQLQVMNGLATSRLSDNVLRAKHHVV